MKKFFNTTVPVLFLFSLIFCACEKPVIPPPDFIVIDAPKFTIKYKWTPRDQNPANVKDSSGSGNINNGEGNVHYLLDPYLHGSGICKGGTWNASITEQPKNSSPRIISQDAKTGEVDFIPYTTGTYKIKITYTCPDCSKTYEATITIEVTTIK